MVMPRRRFRKRNYRRRRRYGKKSNSWLKSTGTGLVRSSPLPKTFKLRTRYVSTTISIDVGVGGIAETHVFSANGLYDPDITGVGHQPLGFDQFMDMYDHYTVIGSRLKATLTNTDDTQNTRVYLSLKDKAATSSDLEQILENGLTRWISLGPNGTDSATRTITMNCNPSKFLGQKVMASTDCKGSSGTNPTEGVFYHLTVAPVLAQDPSSVRALVEIEYIAILTEPTQLSTS